MFGSRSRPGLGSLGGDSLGAREYELEPMSGTGQPGLSSYGRRVSRTLMAKFGSMPNALRVPLMKQAMNAINPTLYGRADKLAAAARARGLPPRRALELGIAEAASAGLTSELVKLGRGRGRSGLGAIDRGAALMTSTTFAKQVEELKCIRPGYTYVAGPTPYWSRLPASVDQQSGNPGPTKGGVCLPTEIRVHEAQPDREILTPEQQAAIDKRHAEEAKGMLPTTGSLEGKFLQIGPFTLPYAKQINMHQTLSPEQRQWVGSMVTAAVMKVPTSAGGIKGGAIPFAKFTRPNESADPYRGKTYGLYLKEDADGRTYIAYREYVPGDSIFEAVWKIIKKVGAAVVNVIKEVVDTVKDAACSLATQPGSMEMAAGANPFLGAGVGVAGRLCQGSGGPGGDYPQAASTGGYLPYIIAGGAGLLVLALAMKGK